MNSMYRVLLLTVFALLCGFSNAAKSGGRLLRVVDSAEERGGFPSYLKDSFTKWRINSKINSWVEKQKTDEYVLKKLGLSTLTGKELVKAAKYRQFQDFKVGVWLKEATPTTSVFSTLGLDKVEGAVEKADDFGTYLKYVMALGEKADDYPLSQWPRLFGGGSPEQLKLKRQLLFLVKRNEFDIRIMLG
ncbi:hypothetical protein DVH05_018009 [Phytophthora capsici]|nr:hypothetical protein DVH05_018003 [Phytophthora capsici]KAG1696784.1 hypothetical protein DVH05_018005 [Phytophthora capsici]KAG1696788.1 hypothetical protein DVH05_018009 [Phytophthora capsici]